jgi:hypothetical protein
VLFAAPAYRAVTVGFLVILLVLTIRPAGLLGRAQLMISYVVFILVGRRHLRADGAQPQRGLGRWSGW